MKVIWAVDPFSGNRGIQRSALYALQALAKGRDLQITPVYVLTAGYFESLTPLLLRSKEEIREVGQREVNKIASGLKFGGLGSLEVILESSASRRKGCKALVNFARSKDADLIALCTHSKAGPQRWVMGSFAETLALICDLPFVAVNPSWNRKKSFEKILFPTDFSDESREAYHQIQKLAKQIGSKIVLYHRFTSDLTPSFVYALQAYSSYGTNYENDLADCKKQAGQWADEARRNGLKIEVVIDTRRSGPVARSILQEAKKQGVGLIAMGARSGAISSMLLGSSTREVLRKSSYPVWVIHPHPALYEVEREDMEIDLLKKPFNNKMLSP